MNEQSSDTELSNDCDISVENGKVNSLKYIILVLNIVYHNHNI